MNWKNTIRGIFHRHYVSDEEAAYHRLAAKNFYPDGIIDVGAYKGDWTRLAQRAFGNTQTLMIEPQMQKKELLLKVCSDLPNTSYSAQLIGAESGTEVTFYEMETGSSFYPENSNVERQKVTLKTQTLDEVASGFTGKKIFLKIDVQGAELDVLKGATNTIDRCELIQLEVPFTEYNKGAPSFLEVLSFMEKRSFVPYDVSNQTRIQKNLVQVDIIFVRRDSHLRRDFVRF